MKDRYGNVLISLGSDICTKISADMYFKYVHGMQPLYRLRGYMNR